jgi:Flp pilus assembly protein CpaB
MSANANANSVEPRRVNVPLVVIGAIVVVASFVATVLVGQLATRPGTGSTPAATQAVLVAARDVAPRTVLVAADLTVAHYAVGDVPPASLAAPAAAIGLVAQTPLKKGQPVLSNQIGKDAGSGALSAYLPLAPGFVAVTVPSDEQHGVGGYIQAGDFIDIVAVVTPKGAPSVNVRTIYSNIRVIRVGPGAPTAGAPAAAQQTGGLTSSLTLAVTQCQAEYLNWFIANAGLRYTLLAYQDYQATPATPDANCPKAGSATGVVEADIRKAWPGLD